jgi:hypothetical protein
MLDQRTFLVIIIGACSCMFAFDDFWRWYPVSSQVYVPFLNKSSHACRVDHQGRLATV